jgi:hypothetical protein
MLEAFQRGGLTCRLSKLLRPSTTSTPFERSSKRRKGYPSETNVKRGLRIVRGHKDLLEKLGRKDLCPCGSGRSFQAVLPAVGAV